jgi:hypothetical protein
MTRGLYGMNESRASLSLVYITSKSEFSISARLRIVVKQGARGGYECTIKTTRSREREPLKTGIE